MTLPVILQDKALQAVLEALGLENARLVGGAVRASLLGEGAGDIDIATTLTPDVVTARLTQAGLKVVPTGIDHGTVTAIAEHRGFEVTTLRRDVATDGRRAVVAFTTDWVEDAQRRDFTMNTLLMDADGKVYDPLGQGLEDLNAGIVRFVGDPATRIAEDALRILRFFRFHARYGHGSLDTAGYSACVAGRHLLENLSRERVTAEIEKLLVQPHAATALMSMISGGVLHGLWQPRFDETAYKTLQIYVHDFALPQVEMTLLAYSVYENEVDTLKAKIDKFFVLSNKKTVFLTKCISFANKHTDSIEKNLYLYGVDITLCGSVLSFFINTSRQDVLAFKAFVDAVRRTPIPVLPVDATDIMKATGLSQGRALGDVLKGIEHWWLEQDTKPDHAACMAYVKTHLAP